ncbi:AlwI family type II restriction endonuclease [Paenibacillus sp. PAMC 26794]|uniref:AlwI family type II restriction endonuclease n=1 Tax=Paenibacillus sp. PAMC 26794 TaxID=1257080 RepID=UPI0002E7FB02|nr:AlwI family type II restriction endonuclease [Paenibacillus sp. PAMC 26794]
MINNWMLSRPNRKLIPIIDTLSVFSLLTLGESWTSDVQRQLNFELELERAGLKRSGSRRDQRAGGARTYESWLNSLGLIYKENGSGILRLTMSGEALLDGEPPVPIMTNQLLKYQYPSPYSTRQRVNVHARFKIRPFRFILKLLLDSRIGTLSKQELARVVITEAENESDKCYEYIVSKVLAFRNHGNAILPSEFANMYPSSTTGVQTLEQTLKRLEDNANTLINYLDYTQLIVRDTPSSPIYIPEDQLPSVVTLLSEDRGLIKDHENEEVFQRRFGLPPGKMRDNRSFGSQSFNTAMYVQRLVRNQMLYIAGTRPVSAITPDIIREISLATGLTVSAVESGLSGWSADTLGIFEASYVDMAFSSREKALDFELATVDLFKQLGFSTRHVGASPRHPDVLIESPLCYSGIIDNKAYSAYSISNDHRNRMEQNYIPTYQSSHGDLAFFMYIAGGFINTIDNQIARIAMTSGVAGSAIKASDMIKILQKHQNSVIDHNLLKALFRANRRITIQDIHSL